MLAGSRGGPIGLVRENLRLGPNIAVMGMCACNRYFKEIVEGAHVPCGAILIQWARPNQKVI